MERKKRFLLSGGLLVVALGYLVYSAVSETSVYYLTIGEFAAKKASMVNEGLRVAGRVRGGSVEWEPRTLRLRFSLGDFESADPGLAVDYTGILPDMFAEGRDVIVEGKYSSDDVFHAHTILTSCPSKYEADDEYEGAGGKAKAGNETEASVDDVAPRS